MRVFSTFTGIGGFEVGIHNAAVGRRNVELVGYSEIDKYAVQVFEKHFKGVKNYGDITKIEAEKLPDFDCLVGGFPCQAFSIAGRRHGFNDTRGTLFYDLARILRAKQPRLFVFENVKGLCNHDGGKTFRTIIATIDELGYDCQWQVLNSKNFGVPQNRERIIIVGHLRGTTRPQVFPITTANPKNIEQINKPIHSNNRIYSPEGLAPSLRTMQGGNRQPKVIVQPVMTVNRFNKKQNGRQVKPAGEPTHTLTAQDRHGVLLSKTVRAGGRGSPHGSKQNRDSYEVNGVIRRLTPLECERLQAFPDNWTLEGVDGPISDSQRYKMCGNAVTTNVIQAVFERIFA